MKRLPNIRRVRCIGVGSQSCDIQTANAGGRCTKCLSIYENLKDKMDAKERAAKEREHRKLGRAAKPSKVMSVFKPRHHGSFQS